GHACLVEDRVPRDHASREQCEADRVSRLALVPRERVAGEQERRGADEDRAHDRGGAGVLAQDEDRHDDGDERTRGARERIDDREVAAAAVGAIQEQEVERVDHAAREHQREVHRLDLVADIPGGARDDGRVDEERDQVGARDEARAAAAFLEDEVPACVDEGREEDESERERRHGFISRSRSRYCESSGSTAPRRRSPSIITTPASSVKSPARSFCRTSSTAMDWISETSPSWLAGLKSSGSHRSCTKRTSRCKPSGTEYSTRTAETQFRPASRPGAIPASSHASLRRVSSTLMPAEMRPPTRLSSLSGSTALFALRRAIHALTI